MNGIQKALISGALKELGPDAVKLIFVDFVHLVTTENLKVANCLIQQELDRRENDVKDGE